MNTTLHTPPALALLIGRPRGRTLTLSALVDRARDATQRWLGQSASDWALWRQAREGDPASARSLVSRLTPTALALARQMLGRTEDAEDAVQESFLRLWSADPSDTHGAQLATYFHTIVLNRCRSLWVRRREWSTDPQDLNDLHDAWQSDQGESNATEGAASADAQRLQAALDRLPPRQRMALAMWAYADADVAQIARALDLQDNAAHQLLHRAKRSLRTAMEVGQP